MLKLFTEQRVAALGRATGEAQRQGQLDKVMGEIRRAASVCVVRAQAVCLLERLAALGLKLGRLQRGLKITCSWWRGGGERLRPSSLPSREGGLAGREVPLMSSL